MTSAATSHGRDTGPDTPSADPGRTTKTGPATREGHTGQGARFAGSGNTGNTVFVTASGTDVGKTFVMCALLEELRRTPLRVRALKPIMTGFDAAEIEASDTGRLLAGQGPESVAAEELEPRTAQGRKPVTAQLDAVSPWRFAAPLSPDMAAARESKHIPFDELLSFCRASDGFDLTLIEGIGGVMVPLDERHTVIDWIAALGAPALLVTGSYLGTLSHTLTAADALRARGVELLGIIVSESVEQPVPLAETCEVLERFLAPTPVVALPRERGDGPSLPELLPLIAPSLDATDR